MKISIIMKKKETLFLLIIIFFSFSTRVIYYNHITKQPEFSQLLLDPQFNDYWAHKILYKGEYPSPTGDDPMIEDTPYGRPPGYPFLLSFIYFFFGNNYHSPRLIQFFFGILNVYLIFYVVSKIFNNKKTGIISAFLIAILWEPIYFEGEINYPVWVILLTIITLGTFLQYLKTKKILYVICSGLSLGLISLFRPNALLLLPMYILLVFLTSRNSNIKNTLIYGTFLTVSTFLVITPILIRNYIVSKEFFLISCFGGINTYIGNNSKSSGDSPTIPNIIELCGLDNWDCFNYRLLVKGLGIKQGGKPYSFKEASQFFYKKAWKYWKEEPISAIKLTFRKILLFWGPAIVSDGKVIHYYRNSSFLRFLPGFPILSGLFLFSLITFIQKRHSLTGELKIILIFLFSWCFVYSFSVIPFFISERYRLPLIPPICIIGGLTISSYLNDTGKNNRNQKFLAPMLCLLCFGLIYIIPIKYQPDESRWFYHKAIVSYREQNVNDAIYYANKSISINPKHSEAYSFLGIISLNQNKLIEAEQYYKKALEINPNYAMANNNLGYVMELQGNIDLAEKYYQKACQLSPVYSLAWINLGRIYLYHQGKLDRAKDCFLKSIELDPNSWTGWFHLGNIYIQVKDYSSAETSLIKALDLNPGSTFTLNNLGFLYIQIQQYDKAIKYLKTVLDKEPNFTDAMFNLGNAFKAINKIDEAENWYKKILEIDPQFTDAKVKLEELKTIP